MAPDPDDVIDRLAKQPFEDLLGLYAELLATDADAAAGVARALRDQARAGALDDRVDEVVPLLAFCLVDAPSPKALFHVAKALAAFGRDAIAAAPYLVERIAELTVADDEAYWILEGCVFALAYLGGDAARDGLGALQREDPPRPVKAGGAYRGDLDGAERRTRYARALAEAAALVDRQPGPWRARRTDLARTKRAAPKKLSPWMTRS